MRIAAVRYINALPLIYRLQENPAVELLFETPAVCYQKLISREADVGLIPVIGTQTDPSIRALKGLGIAAANRSESVYVFSRKPLDRVEDVVTDVASLTSVMLLKIVLREKYHNTPRFHSAAVDDLYGLLRQHDAVLVIGDQAILAEKTDFDHYDLASEWYSITKLPFVFAFWGCSRLLSDAEKKVLSDAYEQATQHWEEIYKQAHETLGINTGFLKKYYNVNLHYRLSRSDYEGLLQFFRLAAELQLIGSLRKDIWL